MHPRVHLPGSSSVHRDGWTLSEPREGNRGRYFNFVSSRCLFTVCCPRLEDFLGFFWIGLCAPAKRTLATSVGTVRAVRSHLESLSNSARGLVLQTLPVHFLRTRHQLATDSQQHCVAWSPHLVKVRISLREAHCPPRLDDPRAHFQAKPRAERIQLLLWGGVLVVFDHQYVALLLKFLSPGAACNSRRRFFQ